MTATTTTAAGRKNGFVLYIAIPLLILLVMLVVGPFSDVLEYYSFKNLSFHMTIEHSIFLGLGALSATIGGYCLQSFRRRRFSYAYNTFQFLHFSIFFLPQQKRKNNNNTIVIVSCLAISAILMGVWHLPSLFAAATFDKDVHMIQHASFIIVGFLAFIALRIIPTTYLILSLVLTNAIMGLFGALLIVSNHQIFFPYSIESHVEAGNVMIMLSIFMAVVAFPAFIIYRSLRYELKSQQS